MSSTIVSYTSSLLGIPLEVRRTILEFLAQGSQLRFHHWHNGGPYIFLGLGDDITDTYRIVPTVVTRKQVPIAVAETCRLLRKEALPIIHANTTVHFCTTPSFSLFNFLEISPNLLSVFHSVKHVTVEFDQQTELKMEHFPNLETLVINKTICFAEVMGHSLESLSVMPISELELVWRNHEGSNKGLATCRDVLRTFRGRRTYRILMEYMMYDEECRVKEAANILVIRFDIDSGGIMKRYGSTDVQAVDCDHCWEYLKASSELWQRQDGEVSGNEG